jgi:hypothetical protein
MISELVNCWIVIGAHQVSRRTGHAEWDSLGCIALVDLQCYSMSTRSLSLSTVRIYGLGVILYMKDLR